MCIAGKKAKEPMLRVTVENISDIPILHCAGRICAGQEAATLRRTVERQVVPRTIIIDLAQVNGIDAAGLGTLVAVRKWVLGSGKELKLMNVTPHFETVLGLTHLASIFEICSVAEMVELLCRAAAESSPVITAELVNGDRIGK
jgi:anti-anti-sigma factor